MNKDLFYVENLRVAYPGAKSGEKTDWAVNNVSFTINPGERLGLVGESGCGKSTLGRAAMRLLSPSSQIEGNVWFQGKPVFDLTTSQLRKFRGEAVALIFQDPMTRLNPLMTIGDHCLETLKAHQPDLSKTARKDKAIETLDKVKIPASRFAQYPHEFSGGMRQRVAIALALLLNPKLIVADEPTTSLDVTVSAEILDELTRLCQKENMGLLLISHDLAMVGEYCDRIAVMYQGEIVETGAMGDILRHPQHEYTRSLLQAALHIQAVGDDKGALVADEDLDLVGNLVEDGLADKDCSSLPISNPSSNNSSHQTSNSSATTPILEVKELKQYYTLEQNFIAQLFSKEHQVIKAVDNVTFNLMKGEVLGLVGESGCGKSTLSRTILQLIRPTSGMVNFNGVDLSKLDQKSLSEMRRQIQMVFQDPHACLNPLMRVGESIADPLFIHKLATPDEAKDKVMAMLKRVGLTEEYYYRYPADLSGGQQQRVAIARALITHPSLVICDEPVSMLDASVQTKVLELMQSLKDDLNLTYLFITHDLWVARFFCDRIAVMNKGKIVELEETEQLFKNPQHPYTKTLLSAAPLLATQMV
ncbi:MAG TPA: ABC transporter ATP-binding protein [Cyanobacteria bacterium UBA11149]|nr:ABC transporter ATP-binding protein [Cyanobacteria bacterium UBA11366]HBR75108.1 ABC transporter ATP-binding protein [Cyanobacteria bacterium UBA11159]HBW87727.1 ABC transporter ATP-binding protein [Cyanobacteria bacterium UBA11149]HCA96297.1 ABC transporter ATP-binding protein [Cyanobacteria bacterium UBA9226]